MLVSDRRDVCFRGNLGDRILGLRRKKNQEAVLMYTYCTVYFTFFDKCFSFLDHWIFIGGTAIFEASVFTPGQNNLNTILFQDRFTF